jgi:hypothetical protein
LPTSFWLYTLSMTIHFVDFVISTDRQVSEILVQKKDFWPLCIFSCFLIAETHFVYLVVTDKNIGKKKDFVFDDLRGKMISPPPPHFMWRSIVSIWKLAAFSATLSSAAFSATLLCAQICIGDRTWKTILKGKIFSRYFTLLQT